MPFSWFDAREAKAFGASLARFYMERAPLGAETSGQKRGGKKAQVLEKMALQITQFAQAHKMNVYKKAQFGNAFRWTLVEAGYDAGEADELTNTLLLQF